jgi:hypothetical protein
MARFENGTMPATIPAQNPKHLVLERLSRVCLKAGYATVCRSEWLVIRCDRRGCQISACFESADLIIEANGRRVVLPISRRNWPAAVARSLGRFGFEIAPEWLCD